MLLNLSLVLVAPVLALLVYAATRPARLRVQRAISVAAPPQRLFGLVNDFREWAKWSPWEHIDPTLQRRFEGPPAGTGAIYHGSGSGKAGAGRMEIRESLPSEKVRMQLDFSRPFEAHDRSEFVLQSAGDGGTTVTWAMFGDNNFTARLVQVFFSMDKMVGKDFETGLASLKAQAEA